MNLLVHLRIVGVLLWLVAALNLALPRRFHWKEELAKVSLLTRQIFHVHAFFILLTIVLMGTLVAVYPQTLLEPSPLARLVLIGLTIFWGTRLVFQWFVYDRRLWRGQTFNTVVHFVFTIVWTYFTGTFAWALWQQW